MELSNAQIRQALAPFGVDVSDHLAGQVRAYLHLLLSWNRKMNLTAITEPQAVLSRHFGESMFAAPLLERPDGLLTDVGSGAGFPGLALKLVCPALRVKLIETTIKKAVFLSEVIRVLELNEVEVIRERAEKIRSIEADVVTARAVGDLPGLVKWASSVVKGHGQVLLWLGQDDALLVRSYTGWDWSQPKAIPASAQRVILYGRRVV